MAISHFGLDGGIGSPKTVDYSGKAGIPPGTKPYTKTFARMGVDGGIIKHARSYAGKEAQSGQLSGSVQAVNSTVNGVISRTALRTLSGTVQANAPTMSGSVGPITKTLSGGVAAQTPVISGTVTSYPLTGWSLTNFTVNYAGLDPDSPFTDPTYSAIVIGDKAHYETLTTPDSHTMTMDGLGEFSISPAILSQNQTFDVQIYDASDGTFGTTATITVLPSLADAFVSGGVTSTSATVSGSLNTFTVNTLSGAVQAGLPVMGGLITSSPTGNLELIDGNVQSGSATVAGVIENVIKLSGSVQSTSATVTGDLTKSTAFSGGVQAQSASVVGDLTPPTEEPGTNDPRKLGQKFINRKIKWKSTQRKIR
jgi:hypothetical protein